MLGRFSSLVVATAVVACGAPGQVSFVSNERPSAQGAPQVGLSPAAAHAENPNGVSRELPNDDELIEPERPAADSKQERALVHIHGPGGVVCSGVVLGPRIVATAQQCLKGETKGVTTLGASREYRVEVASSTLTWTNRIAKFVLLPQCDWNELDIGVLVLAEPAQYVQPLNIVSAPGPGARVQALGYGHCAGQSRSMKDRVGIVRSRVSEAVVIDVPLCRGDTGGPVVDGRDGDVVGLISHRDDPEGSPLRTTTIARLDTTHARELLAQAKLLADGAEPAKVQNVACR
ncbi:MAG: trypsin-like serine protease [Labilithrix sp.]|nr:trypsin-like serine protease [Labilithrix sp.]